MIIETGLCSRGEGRRKESSILLELIKGMHTEKYLRFT
jgi:hypothetical protein